MASIIHSNPTKQHPIGKTFLSAMGCISFCAQISMRGTCRAYGFAGVMQMVCAWKELLGILPQWLRTAVSQYEQLCIQEIRMRINSPPELVICGQSKWLSRAVTADD